MSTSVLLSLSLIILKHRYIALIAHFKYHKLNYEKKNALKAPRAWLELCFPVTFTPAGSSADEEEVVFCFKCAYGDIFHLSYERYYFHFLHEETNLNRKC